MGIVSCSADGSIRIWDTKSTHCIHQMSVHNEINPKQQYLNAQYGNDNAANDVQMDDQTNKVSKISIRNIVMNPVNQEEIYVILSNDSFIVYLLSVKTGHLIKRIESEKLKRYLEKKKQNESSEGAFCFVDIDVSA